MLEFLSSASILIQSYLHYTLVLLIISLLFGVSKRASELLNEKAHYLFKHAEMLFGLLWGVFLAALIYGSPMLGSFYLTIFLFWIASNNLDNTNHRIVATLVIIFFIWLSPNYTFDWTILAIIFPTLSLMALAIKRRKITVSWFTQFKVYIVLVLLFSLALNPHYWIIIVSYALYVVAYDFSERFGKRYLRILKREKSFEEENPERQF